LPANAPSHYPAVSAITFHTFSFMSTAMPAALGTSNPAIRTLLLCDLVASTRLVERVGDAPAADLLARHDRFARDLLSIFHGREIDKSDGFLLLFERPIEAVRFALAYQAKLRELGAGLDSEMASRVGIHLGEVVLRENPPEDVARGAKPVAVEGLAKAIAARVMSLAGSGRILLTRAAYDFARRSAPGRNPSPKRISGFDRLDFGTSPLRPEDPPR
jgi:class 3 adenylate cyclase